MLNSNTWNYLAICKKWLISNRTISMIMGCCLQDLLKHQLYGHQPPITKTIKDRRTRHAGHCWRSREVLIRDVFLRTPSHGRAKAGRPARTYIQQLCVDRGVVLRTCRKRWTIGMGSERGSGCDTMWVVR